MEPKIRRYVESLFEETTPTRKAIELKEEMIQNLEDKYQDLIQEGKTPEAAFNIAIAGIGDVTMLLRDIEYTGSTSQEEAARQKSAMLTAVAVMGYILSPLTLIFLALVGNQHMAAIGLPVLFLFVAGSTGLLIYNSMTKPRYLKQSDDLVEEFREWQAETHETKTMRRAISSALWSIIAIVYFVVSFTTGAWHISWVIWLAGGGIESLINIFFSMKKQ